MKELTIVEKAKRYESALERCRKLYNEAKANEYTSDIEDYETIFPELKESEDEKIRRELIDYINRLTASPNYIDKYNTWIAWLEKQKATTFNKNIEWVRNAAIRACKYMVDNFENSTKQYEDAIAWLRKQDKQKPVVIIPKFRIGDNIKTTNEEPLTITKIDDKGYWSEDLLVCDFDDAAKWELVEQKPAWSEEDELKIKDIEEAITNYWHGYTQDTILDWLKSLKQRIGG